MFPTLIGLGLGFILGMIVNAYLLQGKARDALRTDKKLRMRYGLLNWGIALLGAIIGRVAGQ